MKRYISRILCMFAAVLLLSACGNGSREGGKPPQDENRTAGGESAQDGLESGGTADGAGEDIKNLPGETTGAGKVSGNTSLSKGTYREIGLKNPDGMEERGEAYYGTILNKDGKLELNTLGFLADTGKEMFFCYTLSDDGESWEREPILWTEGLMEDLTGKMQGNRIWLLQGEDQVSYAYYSDEEQFYHMIKQEGDSYAEIVVADWQEKRGEYLGELAVLACGNIVMTDTVGGCYVYSPDGKETLASFRCGWCETLCVSGNEIFVLDYESGSILHFDGENIKMQPKIEGDFTNIVRLSVHQDTLYACSPEGIFYAGFTRVGGRTDGENPAAQEDNGEFPAKQEGLHFRKWLDAGKFHFSKQNGYPLDFYFLGETFYVVYAENWGRIKKYVPRREEDDFLGTLTVYSLETNELVIDMIAEFMMQYPQIDVYYETGEGAEGATLASDRVRALNTRILSGDGPDILILDGLPASSYVDKKILAELGTVLSGQLSDLQENIVANYRQEDGIYMLPLRYTIPMIATSGQNAEIFSSLSALTAYCEEREGNNVIMPGVPYPYILELLYYNFPPKIVAFDGSVNEENILEFIRLTKRFCAAEQGVASEELASENFNFKQAGRRRGYFSGSTLSGYYYGQQELQFFHMTGVYGLSTYPQVAKLRGGLLLGNKGIFFPNGVIGINARTKKKEFTELFLKAAFSYEMQRVHSSGAGFSLHKEVLLEDAQVDRSYMSTNSMLAGTDTLYGFNQKDAKKMIQMVRAVQTPIERNEPIFEIIRDAVCACLRGEQDEAGTVKEILERVQLYYYE